MCTAVPTASIVNCIGNELTDDAELKQLRKTDYQLKRSLYIPQTCTPRYARHIGIVHWKISADDGISRAHGTTETAEHLRRSTDDVAGRAMQYSNSY